MENLPEKWGVLVTSKNLPTIDRWYKEHIDEYKGCKFEWQPGVDGYFHYPQYQTGLHSTFKTNLIKEKYKILSFQNFKRLVLKENNTDVLLIFN